MPLITLAERPGPDGANAVVSFDHGPEHPIRITDPFSAKEEADLEWYFEDYLKFPFVEDVRYREAAASIRRYGEALFQQIFGGTKPQREYAQALAQGVTGLQFEIRGTPEFHRLHWEALQDPELHRAFALDCPFVRRNTQASGQEIAVPASDTLRVLLVTSRPFGDQDVAYRTISRPLVEATRNAQLAVDIHILRPASYRALSRHLEQTRDAHGPGWYHIAHFDVHGAVLSHAECQSMDEPANAGRYLFRKRYGRAELQAYEGHKGFLFLDGESEAGKPSATPMAEPVADHELAALLAQHGIPAVVLNACQSGKQVGASESSLGARLMQAGVQWVLAMGYSVTVSAAQQLMQHLYRPLFAGASLAAALRQARLELAQDKQRRVYYDQCIDLEDWLLPVAYENRAPSLQLRPPTPHALAERLSRQAQAYRAPLVNYGFVGRDLDILQIERRLLSDNILLLRGMAGAGKSTLLRHLAEWWQTTHFVEAVAYFSFEERAWTLDQILHRLAQQRGLLTDAERQIWPTLPAPAQEHLLVERLRSQCHLLILDNLESVTGAALAIPNTLNAQEQARLRAFLDRLAGGELRVLLGSRGPEDWLIGTNARRVHQLGGLDPEAASTLAERVLQRAGASRYLSDPDLKHLMKLLAGFPLAIEVVLANLASQTPAEVLKALTQGDAELDLGQGGDKSASLLRCIEYSHGRLDPEAQALLACLAPFRGVVYQPVLEQYREALRRQPALAGLPYPRWPEVIQEAQNWGLLSEHEMPGYLRLQPTLPWFLRQRLSAEGHEAAILTAFRQIMAQFGRELASLLKAREPQQRQIGFALTRLEYENLLHALKLALAARESFIDIYKPLSFYLDASHDEARGLELGQQVMAALEAWSAELLSGQLGIELVGVVDDTAKRNLLLKRYPEAQAAYVKALELLEKLTGLSPELRGNVKAGIYHQLGMVAEEQRQWPEAKGYYRKALDLFIEVKDRHSQANTYHNLGRVAQEKRQWPEAEGYYRKALDIKIEFNDRHSQAGTYHQLGIVAQAQRQWSDAEAYYRQALDIKIEFNDRHSQASTYGQLGNLAQEQQQWSEAEGYYRKALDIYIEFNDHHRQAGTYHQLGRVAQEKRQWPEAEGYYRKALDIYIEFDDRYEQAGTYHQLGIVAQAQRQWPEAEGYYRKALDLYIEFDDRYEQAGTYYQLGRVAEERGQAAEALSGYLKAFAIYAEFKDEHYAGICLGSLARLHRAHPELAIPARVAETLGEPPEPIEAAFNQKDDTP